MQDDYLLRVVAAAGLVLIVLVYILALHRVSLDFLSAVNV